VQWTMGQLSSGRILRNSQRAISGCHRSNYSSFTSFRALIFTVHVFEMNQNSDLDMQFPTQAKDRSLRCPNHNLTLIAMENKNHPEELSRKISLPRTSDSHLFQSLFYKQYYSAPWFPPHLHSNAQWLSHSHSLNQ
jgi:hypothetical protein